MNLRKINLQNIINKILFYWFFLILAIHLFFASFQYVIPYKLYTKYLLWLSLLFFIADVFYIIFSFVFSGSSRSNILASLKRYFSFEQILLLAFFFWFLLSIYLNGIREGYLKLYFKAYDWYIFDTALCMLVIFPLPKILGIEKTKQLAKNLTHFIVTIYSVFTVICLFRVVFRMEVLDFPSGEQAGFTVETQLMLGFNPNTTGMIAASMVCLCLCMIATQGTIIKVIYLIFSIVHLFVLYLSNSRTPTLATIVLLAFLTFWFARYYLKLENVYIKICLSLILAALVFVFFWEMRKWVFVFFEKITNFQEKASSDLSFRGETYKAAMLSASNNNHAKMVLLSTGEETVRNYGGGLNGRIKFWKATAKVILDDPFNVFFGVTSGRVSEAITSAGRFSQRIAHAHNAILQIGICSGIPAMVAYIVFLLNIVWCCIRVLFRKQGLPKYAIFVGCLLCFIMINMAEPYLFAYFSILSCVFYFICGYIMVIDEKEMGKIADKSNNHAKIISSFIIYLACLIVVWSYSDNYANLNHKRITGSGTKNDPYLIEDKADLCYLRNLVNYGNFFEKCYFLQTKDIDLKGKYFIPIGKYGTGFYFDGIYDGDCHVIKNLNILGNTKEVSRVGLFALLGGTVQNLGIESGSVVGDCAGAFSSVSSDHAVIFNCFNKADVIGKSRAGGICDLFKGGTVINCLNFGQLEGERTADLVSYDAKLVCAKDGENNFRGSFSGIFIPLPVSGESIYEKMNSGLDNLIEMGVIPQSMATFWNENE